MAGLISASGASANNEDAKAMSIVNRPEMSPLIPAPSWTTPPDVFARYYVGSTKQRHNQIKRKQLAKMNRKR